LDNKVCDIIDARCNHEVYQPTRYTFYTHDLLTERVWLPRQKRYV